MKKTTRLVLKGKTILTIGRGVENPHRLSVLSGVSYPTVRKYINNPDGVMAYDARVLPALLIAGQGLTPEEFLNLRIGDLFDLENGDGQE